MADDEKDVAELAKRAVEADRTKQVELAIFYYTLAAEALLNLQFQGPFPINIAQKAHEYINRAEVLKKSGNYISWPSCGMNDDANTHEAGFGFVLGQTADAGANKTQSQVCNTINYMS